MSRRGWIAFVVVLGCGREPESQRDASPHATAPQQTSPSAPATTLEHGAVVAALERGLAAAADDRLVAEQLALAGALESAPVVEAGERTLARVAAERDVQLVADRFFAALQDSPAMRAALVEFAKANPALELAELQAGFVAHVEQRLTRPELAEQLELALRLELRANNAALARALVREAGVDAALAEQLHAMLEQPARVAALREELGVDDLQARLETRLAAPEHAAELLFAFGRSIASDEGHALLAELVDHPRTAALLGAALTRLLLDASVQTRCEALFALALAPEFDTHAFARALTELFDEPVVADEAALLLRSLTVEPHAREIVERLTTLAAGAPLDEALHRALR